jgi:hypothetical protein
MRGAKQRCTGKSGVSKLIPSVAPVCATSRTLPIAPRASSRRLSVAPWTPFLAGAEANRKEKLALSESPSLESRMQRMVAQYKFPVREKENEN